MSQPTRRTRHIAPRLARRPHGLSLVETMICVSILAILMGGALQAIKGWTSNHVVEAAAALLETDLRHARSLALANDTSMRFEVRSPAPGATCYLVYSGPAGSCTCNTDGQAQCTADGRAWRVATLSASSGVRILHSGRPLLFDAGKGTVTPTATLVVADRDGRAIHQIVNLMGRTRSCSPHGLAGLRRCA